MSCIWIHNTEEPPELSSEESVYIYDAGQYMGLLFPDHTWLCWRVLNRVLDGSVVTETIELMPTDWVPLNVISLEEYPLLSYRNSDNIVNCRIPSWDINIHLA